MKRKKRAAWVCILFILLIFFFRDIEKLISALHPSFTLLVGLSGILAIASLILFFTIIIFLIRELFDIYSNFNGLRIKDFNFIIIYLVTFLLCIGPFSISSEIFKSKIVYSADRQSTAAGTILIFRANNRFEVNDHSFGLSEYLYGDWHKESDTLYLKFDSSKSKQVFFDTLVISDDVLIPRKISLNKEARYFGYKLFVKPD